MSVSAVIAHILLTLIFYAFSIVPVLLPCVLIAYYSKKVYTEKDVPSYYELTDMNKVRFNKSNIPESEKDKYANLEKLLEEKLKVFSDIFKKYGGSGPQSDTIVFVMLLLGFIAPAAYFINSGRIHLGIALVVATFTVPIITYIVFLKKYAKSYAFTDIDIRESIKEHSSTEWLSEDKMVAYYQLQHGMYDYTAKMCIEMIDRNRTRDYKLYEFTVYMFLSWAIYAVMAFTIAV